MVLLHGQHSRGLQLHIDTAAFKQQWAVVLLLLIMIVITNPFDSRLQGCEFDCYTGMQGYEAHSRIDGQ